MPLPFDRRVSPSCQRAAAPGRERGGKQTARPLWTGLHQSDRIGKVRRQYRDEPQERKSLNQWRKARGLSIAELAQRAGLGERALEHHLYDARNVGVRVALRLAAALDILVEDVDWDARSTADLPAMPPGEPGTISDAQWTVAQVWLAAGVSKKDLAEALRVSRPTLYKRLKQT